MVSLRSILLIKPTEYLKYSIFIIQFSFPALPGWDYLPAVIANLFLVYSFESKILAKLLVNTKSRFKQNVLMTIAINPVIRRLYYSADIPSRV